MLQTQRQYAYASKHPKSAPHTGQGTHWGNAALCHGEPLLLHTARQPPHFFHTPPGHSAGPLQTSKHMLPTLAFHCHSPLLAVAPFTRPQSTCNNVRKLKKQQHHQPHHNAPVQSSRCHLAAMHARFTELGCHGSTCLCCDQLSALRQLAAPISNTQHKLTQHARASLGEFDCCCVTNANMHELTPA